jgi:hypothetical protein
MQNNVIYHYFSRHGFFAPLDVQTTSPLPHGGDVSIDDNQKLSPDRS